MNLAESVNGRAPLLQQARANVALAVGVVGGVLLWVAYRIGQGGR